MYGTWRKSRISVMASPRHSSSTKYLGWGAWRGPGWRRRLVLGGVAALALLFFAFTTILAYYYMAETNIAYINRRIHRPWTTFVLRVALLAAREASGLEIRDRGLGGRELPPLRIYCSEEAHSSVEKATITLGIGRHGLTRIATEQRVLRLSDGTHDLEIVGLCRALQHGPAHAPGGAKDCQLQQGA